MLVLPLKTFATTRSYQECCKQIVEEEVNSLTNNQNTVFGHCSFVACEQGHVKRICMWILSGKYPVLHGVDVGSLFQACPRVSFLPM